MRPLQFRVLGPLEVANESLLELGGPKPRALLAHLIAHCGEVVSAEALIDALWRESPPASAANSLQSYVSRLRKVVGSDRIESRGSGYVLLAESGEVDALQFERLVAKGRGFVEERPDEAAATLRDALGLWRGRPYADITDGWRLSAEATRLDELRLTAVEDRIEADLACGKHAMVVGELEALVEEHPWRERAWGQLMTALYRAGRQAEALRAFQRARRILGEEVGIEPSSELRAIEDMILQQSPELGTPVAAQPATPAAGMSVRGYELRTFVGHSPHGDVYRAYHAAVGREVDVQVIGADLANDADFIRSFESIARRLGALDHPNIVPVYDFWREPDEAYFVTGCRVGHSLAEVIASRDLQHSEAVHILVQVAAALDAAHARQLVHGSLDAAAVQVDSAGTAVLHGFDPIRPASLDGSVAADLDAFAQLAQELVPSAPALPDTGLGTAAGMAAAYRASLDVGEVDSPALGLERNPYKGLRAFEEADARDFFGRTALVAQLVADLGESGPRTRFLAVVGPSGSGKSSVVKAGLIDAVNRGALPGSADWFTVTMFPGAHPFAELEAALLRVAVNPPHSLLEQLEDGPLGLARAINRVMPDATSDLLLVVDQFEELFTLASEEERERFLLALLTALQDPRSRIRVVITLRADFHDRPLAHHSLAEWMRDRSEVVIPLTKPELEEAIAGPAQRVGVAIEPGLVSAVVSEVSGQAGGLPLMQYALTGLFDTKTGDTMTLAQYEASGGISGAVASRAEATYADLAVEEQKLVRQVFLRLVTVSDSGEATRRRVRSSELMGLGSDRRSIRAVVEAFGRQRLLTFGHDPVSRGPTIEVAHEALLTRWPRLAGWVEAATDDVRSFNRLSVAAQEWIDADRSEDYLVTAGRLDAFAGWAERTDFELSRLEREFLDASVTRRDAALIVEQKRQQREAELERRSMRRLRTLVAVLLGAGVIGSMLTVFAFVQRSQAQQEAEKSRGGALVSEAVSVLDTDPELAILLALEAAAVSPDVAQDAAGVLHRALPEHRTVLSLPGSTAYPAPDGSWLVTGDVSGMVRSFDAASGELLAEIGGHDAEVTAVVVSSDGLEVASGDAAGAVKIWGAQSGQQVGGWVDPSGAAVQMLRFTPDKGSLAVASAGGPATIRDRGGLIRTELRNPSIPPDMERTVHLTADGSIALTPNGRFEVATGELVAVSDLADPLTTHSAISDSGGVEAGAGGPIAAGLIPGTEDGQVWADFNDTVSALTVDAAGEMVAAGTAGGAVMIWEMMFGNTVMELSGHTSEVSTVEFMRGERLLTASPDGTTRVWDLGGDVDREVQTLSPKGCCAIAIGMSGDGSSIAVASWGTPIKMYDTATGRILEQFPWPIGEVWDATAALNRDGSVLVGAGGSGKAWNVSEAEEIATGAGSLPKGYVAALAPAGDRAAFAVGASVEVHAIGSEAQPVEIAAEGDVTAVAYSREGDLLIAGDQMGLLLADPSASYTTERIRHPVGLTPNAVAFSLDGEQFAATWEEGGVSVFDTDSGDLVFERLEDPGAVDVDFAGDGTTLAVLYFDGRLELLDLDTGRLITTIAHHTDNGAEVATSDDGRLLATTSWDGTVRIYAMNQEDLFDIARSRLTRGFSPAECQEYQIDACG